MTCFGRQRQQRIGAALARLIDGCPYPSREAARAHIHQSHHRRPYDNAARTLDLAMRRGLVVELEDGRIVRQHQETRP